MRVYWEDTDASGVVYHARYLNFFERARTEWLRALGFEQSELSQTHGIVFAVRRMEIDYLLPARLDDQLRVSAIPETPRGARIIVRQEMTRTADGELLSRARVEAVSLAAGSFRAVRLPRHVSEKMTA